MNTIEHLLTCLGEEAAEIAQDVAKCLRFGPTDIWPNEAKNPERLTNRQRLANELNDLLGLCCMLESRGVLPAYWQSVTKQRLKIDRVSKYMDYAREVGSLSPLPEELPEL